MLNNRKADAKRIKYNLDKNLKNNCMRMLNKIEEKFIINEGRKI